MSLNEVIADIQTRIRSGQFPNEAAVKQGIVLPILNALNWPQFDTTVVRPEYALDVRRVDFALCHPPSKPTILIEVKDIGNAGGAERQLFEYAFHKGIPIAILTDGQEWSFFLPGEQGEYQERCVYKPDMLARPVGDSSKTFQRYLAHEEVTSGRALRSARDDYRNVSRNKMDLYPGRPDLCEDHSEQHFDGWWIGTNYSRSTIANVIEMASEIAGLPFGKDVILV